MKLLVHLIGSDLRQFRWAIVLWCVLLAADTTMAAMRPALAADRELYWSLTMIAGLLAFGLQIAMLLLVPFIVQAHPAVGTEAFWMTRPVPPYVLFAAKVVLLLLLTVIVPGAMRFTLMMSVHVPMREALLVALDNAVTRGAWVGVLIAGAAVTLNLARFALLCGGVFVSFVVLLIIAFMTASRDSSALVVPSPSDLPRPLEDPTMGVLFLVCVLAAGLVLTAIQYRTRLRKLSMPTGIGALVLTAVALPYWPFPFLSVPADLPGWTADPGRVALRPDVPVIEIEPAQQWVMEAGPAPRTGRTLVIADGLESGWLPTLELIDASFTTTNGTVLRSRGRHQSGARIDGIVDDATRAVARQVLGVEHVGEALTAPSDAVTIGLRDSDVASVVPAQGEYHGRFAVRFSHWEAAAVLPLRPGAVFQDGNYKFAIEEVTAGPEDFMAVRARQWSAASSFDRKPPVTYGFYVRNAQHSHAMVGRESSVPEGLHASSLPIPFPFGFGVEYAGGRPNGFTLDAAFVSFPAPYVNPAEKIDWDPAWYSDAQLVIVRRTETGAIVRTLDMPEASLVLRRRSQAH